MRKLLKYSLSIFLIPLTRWYLRRKRNYTYSGTTIVVWPGVFHPGLFNSTSFLLNYLSEQSLANRSLLELGCGSGLISIICAKRNALVTACDLNPIAIENTGINAETSHVSFPIITSDLMENIPVHKFDWIIINPPYYKLAPRNPEELAWNAGADFEYFRRLFSSLAPFVTSATSVIMVLNSATDIKSIMQIATENGYVFETIREKKMMFDGTDFLFSITLA